MTRLIVAASFALLTPILFGYFGGTRALGAHIWWDVKTMLIGAPIGVGLAFLAGLLPHKRSFKTLLFLALCVLAFATAKSGQTQFAASFGDDQIAGKMWYFGWIATAMFSAATLFTLTR